jgi:circadian clock protein KaiC
MAQTPEQAPTGIAGLDEVLGGGLSPSRAYLIEGAPGTGKTTLAVQFLLEGVRQGEPVLYVTLSETREEIEGVAASHGWAIGDLAIFELMSEEDSLKPDAQYTMFHPSEMELFETTRAILREVERLAPARVVIDSLSEIRLLAASALLYRRQVLALKQFFAGRDCTVLLLDDPIRDFEESRLESMVHGVIVLEHLAPEFGADRRRLRIAKMRAAPLRGGYHDFAIRRGGLVVFPRLMPEHRTDDAASPGTIPSGVPALDEMLGGGLDWGTSVLLMGPAGTGKSSLTTRYAVSAAATQRVAMYTFDESLSTLMARARAFGMGLEPHLASGQITVRPIDPAELSPGEFVQLLRHAVEDEGVRLIVIDSLNGYLNAMPEERYLTIQLRELLTFLSRHGVVTLLVVGTYGVLGGVAHPPIDVSYLSDTVVLLRHYELRGEILQALSVLKKRSGAHARTIRELHMSATEGIAIGERLRDLEGVLSGTPAPWHAEWTQPNGHP